MLLVLKLFKKCTKPDHPLPVLPQKGCSWQKAPKDSLKSLGGKGVELKRPRPSTSLPSQDCTAQQRLCGVGEGLSQIPESCTGQSYSQENRGEITQDRKVMIHSEKKPQ